jgi:Tfp pilus assembly protein PilN
MINLLPPDIKESFAYARKNTLMLKWATALGVAVVGVFVIIFFGQVYISQAIDRLEEDIAQSEQNLQDQNIEEVEARVQEISNSLNLVVDVLSEQILFSSLIRDVGSVIPEGAVLRNLTINELDGGINLSADTTDYETATQVQVNLEDPSNEIFTQADILNIRCQSDPPEDEPYPCQIELRALFGPNSQFLLIPSESSTMVEAAEPEEEL